MTNNSEIIYLYDGSFDGLVSVLRELTLKKVKPFKIISEAVYTPSLFDKTQIVFKASDKDIAEFVIYIINKFSKNFINKIILCYLSEVEDFEILIYDYLSLCLTKGKQEMNNLSNPTIFQINSICSKVRKECHRFYGLLRFQLLEGGIYYAPFEPDYNIITMIAPHFSKRLRNQDWIIHDRKRDLAIFYNAQFKYTRQVFVDAQKIVTTEQEETIVEMWKKYFKHLSIDSRKNPRLQRQFMPKRYWKYLTEKNNL